MTRNPRYYDFGQYNLGGDCTNFVSQCLYAGGCGMNAEWHYYSLNNRAPAWTSVQIFRDAVVNGKIKELNCREYIDDLTNVLVGDVIQLSFDGKIFSHALLVTAVAKRRSGIEICICAHSYDSLERNLSTYEYKKCRLLHFV